MLHRRWNMQGIADRAEIGFICPSSRNFFWKPFSRLGSALLDFSLHNMRVLQLLFFVGSISCKAMRQMCVSLAASHLIAFSSPGRKTLLPCMIYCAYCTQRAQFVTSRRFPMFKTFLIARISSTSNGTRTIGVVGYIFCSPFGTPRSVRLKSMLHSIPGDRPWIWSKYAPTSPIALSARVLLLSL